MRRDGGGVEGVRGCVRGVGDTEREEKGCEGREEKW